MINNINTSTPPPLIYSVSLATFDLHVGNTIAFTYPLRKHENIKEEDNNNNNNNTDDEDKKSNNHNNYATEPLHPFNVIGGARLHDYCFPDGGHDVSSDEVSFLVRLKNPVSPFFEESDQQNAENEKLLTEEILKNSNDNENPIVEYEEVDEEYQEEVECQEEEEEQDDENENPDCERHHGDEGEDHHDQSSKTKKSNRKMNITKKKLITKFKKIQRMKHKNDNTQEHLREQSPTTSNPPNIHDLLNQDSNVLVANLSDAVGGGRDGDGYASPSSSPTTTATRTNNKNSSPTSTNDNNNLTVSSFKLNVSSLPTNINKYLKDIASSTSSSSKQNFGVLSEPISILYGSALYVRAADSAVERGALQRAILVLSRVPLHKPILEFLKIRALPILADAPNYKNNDPRLHVLIEEVYAQLCDMTGPCASSFRIVAPLFAELEAGQRIYLPRVGRLYNNIPHSHHHHQSQLPPPHPASHLVLLGYRASVTSLLRMLGPTHSALLLYAIIARIPVVVIGRSATEVCNTVCACIHLCRPLPIGIGHFAPYAPISVLDKLIAGANTTPFAVVGATNAFIAHKSFRGIVKLLLPSIAQEVLASSAASGDHVMSDALHKKEAQMLKEKREMDAVIAQRLGLQVNENEFAGFAFVQFPSASPLHKVGPAKFLPKSFQVRVKRLVDFANERDASEAHVRSLALALNFALSLEIRTSYGDVGVAFSSRNGVTNVVASPLRDSNNNNNNNNNNSYEQSNDNNNNTLMMGETQNSDLLVAAVSTKEETDALDNPSHTLDEDDFDVVVANESMIIGKSDGKACDNINMLHSFPPIKSREEEHRLMNSLEMALRSFVTERANERNTVYTIHKWFSACRTMLRPIAEGSSPTQKTLFDDLVPTFATMETAVAYDVANLHAEKHDVGLLLTCEDMLLTLGEQQRLCRVDMGRFVEHYRRRAGAAIDMLCSKQNFGAKSRPENHMFCDLFSLPGIECYELQREILLAQASATATISPCETYSEDADDDKRAPSPFWENVDVTLSLSGRFLCLNAAEQSIASKAFSKIAKILPKSAPGQKQAMVGNYYAQQVFPIASVARIEVIEADNGRNPNFLKQGANALASNVIPRDVQTIRLHLHVSIPSKSKANFSNTSNYSSSASAWRAKLDLQVSQRAGISQLLFLLVNKHHDFSQAIRRMMHSSNGLPSSSPTATVVNSNPDQSDIEGFFVGDVAGLICPVALTGPSRLRDVPVVTRDEVYENQRNYPFAGWSAKLMPHDPPAWSDRSGVRHRPKEAVRLPPGYEWASEWALIPYYDELRSPEHFAKEEQELIEKDGGWAPGEESWVYGTFWNLADFHAKKFPICSIRRRRWVRQRRFKPEIMARIRSDQANLPSTVDVSLQEKEENEVNNSLAFASHLKTLEQVVDVKAALGDVRGNNNGDDE